MPQVESCSGGDAAMIPEFATATAYPKLSAGYMVVEFQATGKFIKADAPE